MGFGVIISIKNGKKMVVLMHFFLCGFCIWYILRISILALIKIQCRIDVKERKQDSLSKEEGNIKIAIGNINGSIKERENKND